MKTLRLARIAAEAEGLRLRRQAKRMVVRLVLAVIALAFMAAAVALGHVAVWFALRVGANMVPWAAALVLGGIDMAIALAFVLIAALSGPGQVEVEALQVRQRALQQAAGTLAVGTMLVPAVRVGLRMMRR
jgi:uncharacterized membrane protein (DUF485 family)